MVFRIGSHVSIAGSHDKAFERSQSSGGNTFQIFTGNPRGWNAKDISTDTASKFRDCMKKYDMPVNAHMPYLPNLASSNEETYTKSCNVLLREIERCSLLGIPYLVTHLGSHGGNGRESGINQVSNAIIETYSKIESNIESEGMKNLGRVSILLENTAGCKNSIGGRFEDIGDILSKTDDAGFMNVGVCFDTCHAFAAGYDLASESDFIKMIEDFDTQINLKRLKVIHLNDTKGECASHLDRHEHIGLGKIGYEGIKRVVNHPRLESLPFILETPIDERRDDKGNIEAVLSLRTNINI